MLRIWAVIAGLFLFAPIWGQPLAPGRAPRAWTTSAKINPAAVAEYGGAKPVPQVMQVYVMSTGGPGMGAAGGNVAAAQSPGGLDSQGTAFYLASSGRKVIVAPYHAWVLAGAGLRSGEVYLSGETRSKATGKWTWWSEPARVLAANKAEDVVFLDVPPELKDVTPLAAAAHVAVGNSLHGTGYAGGMVTPNAFCGNITYYGSETELAGKGEASWRLNFQGYALQGDGVRPGDSGSPALTEDGRVAGEVVAAGNGWILVVPASAIRQAMSGLPAA